MDKKSERPRYSGSRLGGETIAGGQDPGLQHLWPFGRGHWSRGTELDSVEHETHFRASFDPNLGLVLMNPGHSLPSLEKTQRAWAGQRLA